ncbi:hypothetical protein CMQ_959 [Grosmannia clavigera kw1407]|uniref:Uncharacterized protein n=1 Tax=Grosmannia clavigera (strain kw1407 / UAMH 11150) TaxID=655863 RepID=F0XCF4_GROCL|nr:uncharacterized protein CMQ_959 [Grosmannia clavigera kw1407]EFX04031.1 hypothetical protein CMQ_959 [Grosmannia clavigera kw1407]
MAQNLKRSYLHGCDLYLLLNIVFLSRRLASLKKTRMDILARARSHGERRAFAKETCGRMAARLGRQLVRLTFTEAVAAADKRTAIEALFKPANEVLYVFCNLLDDDWLRCQHLFYNAARGISSKIELSYGLPLHPRGRKHRQFVHF